MSSHTFYIPPERISGETAVLTGEELRHAGVTLRLGSGDSARIIDGAGGSYEARFESLGKKEARLKVHSRLTEPEPLFSLTLAMGIVPGERFEWAVQKGTELGASVIIPLVTERTELKAERPWKRLERLRRIMISACKQCGRARFPGLSEPLALADLDPGAYGFAVAFWEDEDAPLLADLVDDGLHPGTGLMVVGPVGGFSSGEADLLKTSGCVLAGLGPRVLRTETAVAAGVTLLQYLFGDMG